MIVNLLSNAIDAMPGGGRILVRTAATCNWKSGETGLALTIHDNGSGMAMETVTRLFEPFYSTKGITGTGLGLWVSKEIVDRHHGSIRVRSRLARPGKMGATVFRVFFPAHGVPAPAGEPVATGDLLEVHAQI